jgi:hypothetical protein
LQHPYETFATYMHLQYRGRETGASRFQPSGWEPPASAGARAPPVPGALVGAPWLNWGRPEAHVAAIDRGSGGPWRWDIPMALGWGRGQRGATRTEGGSGVVSLGGGRRQRWRTRVSTAASGRERVRACEREREREMGRVRQSGEIFFLRESGRGGMGSRVWTSISIKRNDNYM